MTERISLAEAYNNKDVITQIAILKDKLDSIPDADPTNVVLKTGDQIIDGEKTFNDPIVANGVVVFANSGIHVNGTLEVDGDIIQNGSAYETHAEQVFTKMDLIVTREDAIGALAAGTLSGIRVKKYDGVSDLNLGVDASGMMRVGDVGQEQPLMTRDETADMTSGNFVLWDGVNNKAITSSLAPSGVITGSGNIGSDAQPVKIVSGSPVGISDSSGTGVVDATNATVHDGHNPKWLSRGGITTAYFDVTVVSNTLTQQPYKDMIIATGFPPSKPVAGGYDPLSSGAGFISIDGEENCGWCYVDASGRLRIFARNSVLAGKVVLGSVMYISE